MRFFAAALLTLSALAAPAPAKAQANGTVDYLKDANWLCRPGRADVCSRQPVVTALLPAGYGQQVPAPRVGEPAVDCFYVYPTISHDQGMNSDLAVDDREEVYAVQSQFARFAGVCRPFAPIYRQMTMAAVAAAATGASVAAPAALAYGDVAAAFRRYIANDNKGRPFVLIGHSQGSLMLIELIKHEIEGKPIARQMQLAIVPGFNVLVPQGKRVGGSFASTPTCNSPTETGCVISWVSYRDQNVPPPGALFGYADKPGMTVACVNPARPGATGWVPMNGVVNARSTLPVPGGPITWSSTGAPPSTFLQIPALLSSRCANDGPRGYLSVRINANPADARTDRIGGEVGAMGFFLPGWGMHLMDLAGPMDDLVAHVAALNPLRSGTAIQRAR